MIAWKLALRETRQRPGRAALTLASVVIGVAALVAVTLAADSADRAFEGVYASIAGKADLEVSASVGATIPESLLARISALPGVAGAAPRIQRPTVVYHGEQRIQLFMLGIDPERDRAVQDYTVVAGRWLGEVPGVVMNSDFAANLGLKVDDRLYLLTRAGRIRAQIIGLYSTGGVSMPAQGAVLLMPLESAQAAFKAPDGLDAIQVVLRPDVDSDQAMAEIAALLPEGAMVRPPSGRSPMAEETSLSTQQGLNMARGFSLLVAVFIIANTFLISVTQRRRQFGIMRAIGATRSQIVVQVLAQALLLGVGGTILGSALGVVAAKLLAGAMGSLYNTTLPPSEVALEPFLWAGVFGLGVSLAGAALPARKAANLSPLEALRDALPAEMEGFSRGMVLIGAVIVLLATTVLGASVLGRIGMQHAVWSSVLLLAGLVFWLPMAIEPLSTIVSRLMPPGFRVESRLAGKNLLIHRSRTALTIGVVFIAVSTGVGLANSVIDNVDNVRNWYRKSIVADFIVRATAPDMSTGMAADIPDEVSEQIASIAGVTRFDAVRIVSAEAAGQPVIITLANFADPELHGLDIPGYDEGDVRRRVAAGEVLVGSVLAQRAELKAGDTLTLTTDKGDQPFRIAAVANDYHAGGLTVLMQTETAQRTFGAGGIDAFAIDVEPARRDRAREALVTLCRKYGLLLQRSSDIQAGIDRMMAGVVAGLWGMVVLGLVIAAFGVTNTLTMSVLAQTFELGLLRIVAATRTQIRKIVFAEALLMGLIAVLPGIVAGVGVGYLIHLATLPVIGHPVAFAIHPLLLVGALVGGLAVVLAAAAVPAERAARLDLRAAIRFR